MAKNNQRVAYSHNYSHVRVVLAVLFICLLAAIRAKSAADAQSSNQERTHTVTSRAAGEENAGTWWMQQTALTREGQFIDLKTKPWWQNAVQLAVAEKQVIDVEGDKSQQMLIRREKLRNRTGEVEALVWVIDDDGDGSVETNGDRHSDCYVVDYGADGIVDRMVDYIDNDSDGDADEMDIRYFVDGQLRQMWCGVDLDDDNAMWDLAGYEYSGNFFKSDPHGDGLIYMNKFDPSRGQWVPISECPFAFYDPDHDGFSEYVIRVSAVPLTYDKKFGPDYANDPARYLGPWNDAMRHMGISNIRYSFDADNLSGKDSPLHYEFGFNLVGAAPYEFAGMNRTNPKRRPPQATFVIPHDSLPMVSDQFEASETGFSWREQQDGTIAIGTKPHADLDYRWEGVFWLWERRFMENTGAPCQKWNVRREWSPKPSNSRELYYSGVDRRIHLRGAEEGWIEIGNFGGLKRHGEIRMFDSDGNGYFDRWEVYLGNDPTPVRVSTVRDEKVQPVPRQYESLVEFYGEEVLPAALTANQSFIEAMQKVHPYEIPSVLKESMQSGSPNDRRFAQDVVREIHYQRLRQSLMEDAQLKLVNVPNDDLRSLIAAERRQAATSQSAWQLVRLLQKLDVAYGQGDFELGVQLLDEIGQTKESWNE